ncbi:hypothetical protein [Parasphingorhabdus sp.]|uniref:hypothetical protein n=1 Tax=Parasphingorhabdus sp. TaxID=2709688 RepID=UPI003D28741E
MDFFPSLNGLEYSEVEKRLYDAISNGDVRTLLEDVVVPKPHIAIYLRLFQRAFPDQQPFTLPPNLGINYDDLCAFFDRPTIDNRKRGRPVKEHSGWSEDRHHAAEIHRMLAGDPKYHQATSATDAARQLVVKGKVSGAGTDESKTKRLVRAFRKYYST